MEAPEKLYVDTEDSLSDSILYGFTEKRKDDDIEYVRTDAFVDKATSYVQQHWIWNTKMIWDFVNFIKEGKVRKKGIDLIAEERQRQINNGYDSNHDMHHDFRELVQAAITYMGAAFLPTKSKEIGNSNESAISWHEDNEPWELKYIKLDWPWEEESFKPTTPLQDLIKAGALIAAAIDRLQKDYDQQ